MRVIRDEQVALLTCPKEHHSFLLDSSEYWDDVVQDGRPHERRCKCGGREFEVSLDYEMRDDGDVRSVSVETICVSCEKRAIATTFDIGLTPTDTLLSRPLEPCDEPWLIPKRTELTGLWVAEDLRDLVRYLGEIALCYYAPANDRPALATASTVAAALDPQKLFHLYFSTDVVEVFANPRDCWKRLPVIYITSPFRMIYRTGAADLYYMRWARELIVKRQVVQQQRELLALTDRLMIWLNAHFTSARGEKAFDNNAEYERLKGGW